MIQDVKKAIFEKTLLPSLIVPDAINKNPIGIASFDSEQELNSTLYGGDVDLLKFTPKSVHNLVPGDIIELRGLYRVTRADGQIVSVTGEYDIPNIVIYKVDTPTLNQIPSFYIKNDLENTGFTQNNIGSDKLALAEEVEDELPQYFLDNPSAIKESKFAKINSNYVVRYRIVSEDKNRTSHWSPIYQVSPVSTTIKVTDSNIEFFTLDSNTATVSWSADDLESKQFFDVYVGYGFGSLNGKLAVQSVSFSNGVYNVTTSTPHNLVKDDVVLLKKDSQSNLSATVFLVTSSTSFQTFTDVSNYVGGTLEINIVSGEPNIYIGPNDGVSPMRYVMTTSGNTASFKIPVDATRIKVIVQTQTIPRKLVSSNRVAETSIRSSYILRRS
jgi:hypothetical protein